MRNKTAKRLPPIDTLAMRIRAEIHRSFSCCFLAQRSREIARPMNKGAAKKLKIGSFRQEACAGAPAPPGGTRAPRAFFACGFRDRGWPESLDSIFSQPQGGQGGTSGVSQAETNPPRREARASRGAYLAVLLTFECVGEFPQCAT